MKYFDKAKISSCTANISQLASVRECVLKNGPGSGIRVIDVDNGTGLQVSVNIDRGMDLGRCTYRGIPIAFQTSSGVSHPSYYNPYGINWLRSWGGGLMTGAGLKNVGIPQETGSLDEPLGLHGRLSNTPGRLLAVEECWEDNDYIILIKAEVRESSFFGDSLVLERTIRVESVTNAIRIIDKVTNEGPRPSPFMILYHFNLGYPLLDYNTRIECEALSVEPRDEIAAANMDGWNIMDEPSEGFIERCYYPDIVEKDGRCSLSILNPELPFKVALDWRKKELPFATVWKMLGIKEYALGLEPMNCHPGGQKAERDRGTLVVLEPDEYRELDVRLTFIDN